MGTAPQDLLNIYWLGRQIAWRYKLDAYDNEVLKRIQGSLATARREIQLKFEAQLLRTDWSASRAEEVLYALDELTQGVRLTLADQIGEAAGFAGQHSLAEHSDILSVGGAAVNVSFVSLSAEQIRQMFVDTPLGGKTLSAWVDAAFDTTVKDGIKEELNVGMLQGEGYPKLVKRLSQGFDMLSKEQATTLARTYVQSANVAAMEAVYKQNADVVKRVKWRATLEPGYKNTGHGTCLRCSALDSKEWALGEAHPDIPLHPRCFIGETQVEAPGTIAAMRSYYSGDVVTVKLESGNVFTCTPNHNILTDHGFIPAEQLASGDYTLCNGRRIEGCSVFTGNDDNDKPSKIAELFDFFKDSDSSVATSMEVTGEHFHGDGRFMDGNVDVVTIDGLLLRDFDAFFSKHFCDFGFKFPDMRNRGLPGDGETASMLMAVSFAAQLLTGLGSMGEALFGGHTLEPDSRGCRGVSNFLPSDRESPPDNAFRDTKLSADFVSRLSAFIGIADIIDRELNPTMTVRAKFFELIRSLSSASDVDIQKSEHPPENLSRYSSIRSHLVKSLSGFVGRDKVVDVTVKNFSGHVYDLQTLSSVYYANGVIASNCRCVLVPVTISWRDLGIPLDELQDAARPYTMRPDKTIGVGGAREIEEYGFHQGDYGSWFEKQSDAFKLNAVGPGRLDMLKSGKVKFGELVDGKGNLLTLEELNRVHGN